MLKRAIRGSIRRLKKWLDEDSDRHRLLQEGDFEYPHLNAIFSKMVDGGLSRPHYAWGMLQGVNLAKALGINRISMLEFGVAGGNGVLAMEGISEHLRKYFAVEVDIYGFDTGAGLPDIEDYRDVPNLASTGLYKMDEQKLRNRLCRAQLILGNVQDTIAKFVASKPAPVAFIACDLVLYSSTAYALKLFDADEAVVLPRVHCYFDDVLGWTFGDHNGERLAIHEFNASHSIRKISPIYGLRYYLPRHFFDAMWADKFWIAHIGDHSMYALRDNLVINHNLALRE
jgi:hypothetical protein